MAMRVRVDNRVLRDARKWQRFSRGRRLLISMMDPEKANRMQANANYVAMIEAGYVPAPMVPTGPRTGTLSWWLGLGK